MLSKDFDKTLFKKYGWEQFTTIYGDIYYIKGEYYIYLGGDYNHKYTHKKICNSSSDYLKNYFGYKNTNYTIEDDYLIKNLERHLKELKRIEVIDGIGSEI